MRKTLGFFLIIILACQIPFVQRTCINFFVPVSSSVRTEGFFCIFPFFLKAQKITILKNNQETIVLTNLIAHTFTRSISIGKITEIRGNHSGGPSKTSVNLSVLSYLTFIRSLEIQDVYGLHIQYRQGFYAIINKKNVELHIKGKHNKGRFALIKDKKLLEGSYQYERAKNILNLDWSPVFIRNFHVKHHIDLNDIEKSMVDVGDILKGELLINVRKNTVALSLKNLNNHVKASLKQDFTGTISMHLDEALLSKYLPQNVYMKGFHMESTLDAKTIHTRVNAHETTFKNLRLNTMDLTCIIKDLTHIELSSKDFSFTGTWDNGKLYLDKALLGARLRLDHKTLVFPIIQDVLFKDRSSSIYVKNLDLANRTVELLTLSNFDLSAYKNLELEGKLDASLSSSQKGFVHIDQFKRPFFKKHISMHFNVSPIEQHISIDGKVSSSPQSFIEAKGTVSTLGNVDLACHVHAQVDDIADIFWHDQNVAGRLEGAFRIFNTIEQPRVTGTLRLTNGFYENLETGINVINVQASVEANDRMIHIKNISAVDSTKKSGTCKGSGFFSLDDHKGSIDIALNNFRIFQTDYLYLPLHGKIHVTSDPKLTIHGALHIKNALFQPDLLKMDFMRFDVEDPREPARKKKHIRFPDLKLSISVDPTSQVRMTEVRLRFKGAVTLFTKEGEPFAEGKLNATKGRVEFLNTQVKLQEGWLLFDKKKRLDPRINVVFKTSSGDKDLFVVLKGRIAEKPRLMFFSNPPMSQEDVLGYLLFGKESGALTTGQALHLSLVATNRSKEKSPFKELLKKIDIKDTHSVHGGEPEMAIEFKHRIDKLTDTYVSLEKEVYNPVIRASVERKIGKRVKGVVSIINSQDEKKHTTGAEIGLKASHSY